MISTNGQSPKLANLIKKKVEQSLPEHAGKAIEKVGVLRAQLKERAPGVGGELGKRRMKWMIDVCNAWELDELASLDDTMITNLLNDGWEKARVPKVEAVGGQSRWASKRLSYIEPPVIHSALGFVVGAACMALYLMKRP
jgi:precorrin-2 dehydrogenase/sirohydrochlorin ferrochelatase